MKPGLYAVFIACLVGCASPSEQSEHEASGVEESALLAALVDGDTSKAERLLAYGTSPDAFLNGASIRDQVSQKGPESSQALIVRYDKAILLRSLWDKSGSSELSYEEVQEHNLVPSRLLELGILGAAAAIRLPETGMPSSEKGRTMAHWKAVASYPSLAPLAVEEVGLDEMFSSLYVHPYLIEEAKEGLASQYSVLSEEELKAVDELLKVVKAVEKT